MDNEANANLQRGEHLLEIGRPAQAIEWFQRALSLEPENALIFCNLSYAFLQLEDSKNAMTYAERAAAADPDEEWSYRLQAYAHLLKDRRTSAYRSATRAVQLEPENASCLSTLAQCAFLVDRVEEARLLGRILVRQHPESTSGHRILAEIAVHEEDFAAASAGYEKVLALDSQDDEAMTELARIRSTHSRFSDSASLLRGAVHLDPKSETRRDDLRDSMASFALFGQANERRKSVAASLAGAFVVYLGIGIAGSGYLQSSALWRFAYMIGLPLLLLAMLPVLRSRFLKRRSQQLYLLHRNISRDQRRRMLLAGIVATVTAYGITAIVYADRGNPFVFGYPPILLLCAVWIYTIVITLRLLSLWVADALRRAKGNDQSGYEEGRKTFLYVAMSALSVIGLTATVVLGSNFVLLLTLALIVVTAVLVGRRHPLGTGIAVLCTGLGLTAGSLLIPLNAGNARLRELGLTLTAFALAAIALAGWRRYQRQRQRRRIARLLGTATSELETERDSERCDRPGA